MPSDAASRFVTLYLVQGDDTAGDALVAVRREVAVPEDTADLPRVVAEALIAAGPDELGRADLVNALPSDVQVRSAVVGDDGVLDLDLTNLGNVESSLQRLAVAQLVFTLTDLTVPQVSAVRFSIDGEEVAVPLEGGVAPAGTPVSRDRRAPAALPPVGRQRPSRSVGLGLGVEAQRLHEGEPLELAGAGVGQLVDDEHVLRALVGGQVGPGVVDHLRRA